MALDSTSFTGNGTAGPYAIAFPYLFSDDVHAYVDGEEVGFSFLNPSAILLDAPAEVGAQGLIRRITPNVAPLVDWTSGANINEKNLDLVTRQLLYGLQELFLAAIDAAEEVAEPIAEAAIESATAAAQAAIAGAQATALAAITSAQSGALAAISTAQGNAVAAVGAAETSALGAIAGAQSSALSAIDTAETAALTAIAAAEAAALDTLSDFASSGNDWFQHQ